ncbi:MAG TPA: ATP-binding protein [Burkholderiales bacterium]|jgi:serine/threonine-protein kinase RsbW|nr:ATP-binding protein [Burkholderiales bacterium]
MAAPAESRQFVADMKALPELLEFAAAAAGRAGFDGVAQLFVELIIEELFTNTVVHGYGGDSNQPVWVSVVSVGVELSLTYEDAAPPCNPLTLPAPGLLDAPLDQRPVGGLGMPLVKALSDAASYAYQEGRNRLTLAISPRARR